MRILSIKIVRNLYNDQRHLNYRIFDMILKLIPCIISKEEYKEILAGRQYYVKFFESIEF